ncbi:unnamed protein product [Ixodes persulcatus]
MIWKRKYLWFRVFAIYTDKPQKLTLEPVLGKSGKIEKPLGGAILEEVTPKLCQKKSSTTVIFCVCLEYSSLNCLRGYLFGNHTPNLVSFYRYRDIFQVFE